MKGEFKWRKTIKSLVYPLLLFIAGIVFIGILNHSDASENDFITISAIVGIVLSIAYIPNMILFCQYYLENKNLKYNINMSSSTICIENNKTQKIYSFEDILISKIYFSNYKHPKFSGPYELFYRNVGYWYIHLNTGEAYRITSLIADMELIPTICDTELIYVAIPTFKKEAIDEDREMENN